MIFSELHMPPLTRREFGKTAAASVLGLGASTAILRAAEPKPRLAVSTWSFHNYFPNTRYGPPQFTPDEWKIQDVVRKVKERLGLAAFEISSAHLASFEPGYLDDVNGFLKEQECSFIHLSDNLKGVNLARADKARREADLKTFERLLEVAQKLHVPSMRVNTGKPEDMDWDFNITIDCFRRLARFGKERGVEIVIENHFGISADPKNVARIVEAVGDNISACPDFGLFARDEERWPGLALLFKNSRRICSAKFHGFDAAGTHPAFDLERCYRILKAAKFAGWVSLEYEGRLEPLPQLERMTPRSRAWLKDA